MKLSSFLLPSGLLPIAAAVLSLAAQPALAAKDVARPLIPLLSAEQVTTQCEVTLKDLNRRVKAFENMSAAKAKNTKAVFAEWDALAIAQENLQGPLDLISNVSPDAKVRANAEPCLVKLNAFSTELFQNDKVFQKIKGTKAVDAIDVKYRQDALDGFEDTGVTLGKQGQDRMRAISHRLDELSQEFARNVRDNTQKLTFTADEMKGMPPEYLTKAKKDDKGNYLLGFDYPEYNPFMEYADSSAARQRYQFAFSNHGTPKNLGLMQEALDLRREMAGLFGFKSYADFMIRRRMAGSSANVYQFLGEVQTAVTALEKKELEELRGFEADTLKQPLADTKLARWDVPYWQQKIKQARYSVDQNAMRKYFPTSAAVPWALDISSKLYGIEFKEVKVPVWHPEVKYYDVIDSASHARIAGIYLDLFPREGKYGHAAAWPVRGVSTLVGRAPVSALVTNFNRDGLDSGELETLVHEFGHVLHGVLSSTRYVRQAGTNVELDFVEAPSQMYEEWARRKESLVSIANFCKPSCPVIDDALLGRLNAAHNFGRGIRYARQLVYASYDMNVHNDMPSDPMTVWKKVEGATPLGYVDGTEFPGQFGHLMNGYGAGYYGYMWSEVMALDMLSGYEGKLMNPAVGHRYRKEILSRGGELHGADLVRSFLGRAPSSKAFFDEISGQRLQ
jgi:thimet oligopeptidase